MRSARPRPQGFALVSRAPVCETVPPIGSALARGQSRGRSVNRQSAHRPALDRRAARAIILFARRQPAKAPIGFARGLRREGRACARFFGAAGRPGRSARGPSVQAPKSAAHRSIGLVAAAAGFSRAPFPFLSFSFLSCFLSFLRSPFCFFRISCCATRPSRKTKHGRPLSALPFSSSGFPLSDAPSPGNKKSGEIRRERSALGKFDWIRAPGPFGARPWSHSKSSLSMRDCLFSEFWPSSHS